MEESRALDSPLCYRPVCSSHSQLCLEALHKSALNAVEKGQTGVNDVARNVTEIQ